MMYELHLPLVMLANRQLQKGPNTPGINRGEIKDNLKVIRSIFIFWDLLLR